MRFKIDFFELSFLAETCIPPTPIARSMFWSRLCDEIYHDLSKDERNNLFEWITKNSSFDIKNEGCELFHCRFNPDNQYKVTVLVKNKKSDIECFKYKGRYHSKQDTSIVEDRIQKVEPIN